LIAILLMAGTATADPPKHLPKGERIDQGTPTERQCYSATEFVQLLQLDAAHQACLKQRALLEDQNAELKTAVENLLEAAKLQAKAAEDLRADRDRMFELWKEENRRRHEAEQKPHWGSWLGWGTAAVMTVTTAVLTGYVLASD
jgi:hypothetical protein